MSTIRVAIVEDQAMIRDALASLIEQDSDLKVTMACGYDSAPSQWRGDIAFDVCLLDSLHPPTRTFDTADRIGMLRSDAKIIISRAQGPLRLPHGGLTSVRGIISTNDTPDQLRQAVHTVAGGGVYITCDATNAILAIQHIVSVPNDLTTRERQVLRLIAQGQSTKEISNLLSLSPKTIDHHRQRLMTRLDIHNVAGLTRYAVRHRLVSP